MTVSQTAPLVPSQRPALAAVLACQECGTSLSRGRGGPAPRWCPECRAERNREAAAARRRASTAALVGVSRVAGSRNRRTAFQLPPEEHLALRVVKLRTAVNLAAAELSSVLGDSDGVNVVSLLRAATTALELLQAVPVGR